MKVCAISDLHGKLPEKIESCDLLLIAGDIVPLNCQFDNELSQWWFTVNFKNWIDSLPVSKILFVGGNHDKYLCKNKQEVQLKFPKENKCTYLCNELYEYNGLKIFASPYCHQFGNWYFMHSDEKLAKLYSEVPENVDILMVHDMPYNCSDQCLGFNSPSERELHRGSKPLEQLLVEKHPIKFIGGHLHTCDHNWIKYYDTEVVCASLLNESYQAVYDPIYFDV